MKTETTQIPLADAEKFGVDLTSAEYSYEITAADVLETPVPADDAKEVKNG